MSRVPIDDLAYELRMLFGAGKVCQLLDQENIGNPVNFVKDSAYAHTRNLYNFFAADTRNDAKVTQFTSYQFDLSLYHIWKGPLHNHVLHIKESRRNPTNIAGGNHLKDQIQNFADDIEKLWQDWIDHTASGSALEVQLKDILSSARSEAQDDYDSLSKRLITE